MISFWERESFTTYDYIIIGSGIVGLSTAAALKEADKTAKVLVLERGILPTGASTKNAGFACIGSLTELLDDLESLTEMDVVNLVKKRHEGLQKMRHRLGDAAIDYQELGSFELIDETELPCLQHIDRLNTMLYDLLGGEAFTLVNHKLTKFGFAPERIKAVVSNNYEGQLDTGKMMRALLIYTQQLGITIINGAEVLNFDEQPHEVRVRVKHHYLDTDIFFTAKKLGICTNAFSKKLLPQIDLSPGRGQVLVTHPIEKLPFKGIFHFDKGYYYFRNFKNRVIFGGGRNLDKSTETSTKFIHNTTILNDLKHKLRTFILPNTPFSIDLQWTGIMGFGNDKVPIIQAISKRTAIGVKLGGMGVAIGSGLGETLANILLSNDEK